MMKLFN